jgi:hypothetical protein
MTDIARKSIGADSVIETKTIEGFEIKDADRGEVVAVVSTMNVVDRDGDVVLRGAIKDGSVVKLSAYEHDVITEGKAPVGRGVVSIVGDRAILNAKYFMSTERGRDAFNTVREMGAESEWSIGFSKSVKTSPMTDEWKSKGARRLIAGLNLYESSPVFMGANGMTATVSAKAASGDVEASAEGEAPAEVTPGEPPETKAQMVRDLVAELKAARENVAQLEAEQANAVAKEIFERFRRNFKS